MVVVLTHSLSNIGTNRPQQIVLLIQQGEGNNEPISLLFSMNINQPLLLILTHSPSGASMVVVSTCSMSNIGANRRQLIVLFIQ